MTARARFGAFLAGGLAVVLALVLLVAPRASSQPDGLNRVAIDQGFDVTEAPHALGDLPTAGYSLRGVDDDALSTGLAGIVGAIVTFAVIGGALSLARHLSPSTSSSDPSPSS